MAEHPIQGLMQTAMENIKGMVDVNTIVGDPVNTPDGSVILPISKVAFGFAAGGSDYNIEGSSTYQPGANGTHGSDHSSSLWRRQRGRRLHSADCFPGRRQGWRSHRAARQPNASV